MFRDVPECSGMFHVPAFIDDPHVIDLSDQILFEKKSYANRYTKQFNGHHTVGGFKLTETRRKMKFAFNR